MITGKRHQTLADADQKAKVDADEFITRACMNIFKF